LRQAEGDAADNAPVILHRANGKPWLVICKLSDLPKIATQVYLTLAANPKEEAVCCESWRDDRNTNAGGLATLLVKAPNELMPVMCCPLKAQKMGLSPNECSAPKKVATAG
jgi:hypothetical protein